MSYLFWRGYGADIIVCQRLTTIRVFPAMHPESSILLRIRRLRGIGLRVNMSAGRPEAFRLSGTPPSGEAGRGVFLFKNTSNACFIIYTMKISRLAINRT